MKALLIDVDGVVDEVEVAVRAGVEAVIGCRAAPMPLGAAGRHLEETAPHRRLAVWAEDCGVLGELSYRPNILAAGILDALDLVPPKVLRGPVLFTESTDDAPLAPLGDDLVDLLTGTARRWTLDHLERLTAVARTRRLTTVMYRDSVEILDTTDLEDVVSLRTVASAGGVVAADRALDGLGYERTGPWESAEILLEDPDIEALQAPIRKK